MMSSDATRKLQAPRTRGKSSTPRLQLVTTANDVHASPENETQRFVATTDLPAYGILRGDYIVTAPGRPTRILRQVIVSATTVEWFAEAGSLIPLEP